MKAIFDRSRCSNYAMMQTKLRFLSFEEYLSYDDGTDNLYELFNGELIEVPPESGENVGIATFLLVQIALMLGHLRVRGHGLELEVRGEPRNRYPDLTVIRTEHIDLLHRRNTIRLSMAPPLLVVEIVSPGELQRDRDYVAKRSQYQDLCIPEYWIVDPQVQTVLVLELTGETHTEVKIFKDDELIRYCAATLAGSPQLSELNVSIAQIFAMVVEAQVGLETK